MCLAVFAAISPLASPPCQVRRARPSAAAAMEMIMARAERLKATVVNAVANGEYQRLKSLLDQIFSLQPSVEMLHQTGLGFLVADKSCWTLGGAVPLAKSIKITASWKAAIHKAKKSATLACGAATRPFGPFHKAADFCKTMEIMRAELIDAVPLKYEKHVYHRAAVDAVLGSICVER